MDKTIFISYQLRSSKFLAAYIDRYLSDHGYDVFRDARSIPSGDWEQVLLSQIGARTHVVVILTPTSLESEWVRREIEHAMLVQRNIIPLLVEGFTFDMPAVQKYLVGNLENLPRYNGLRLHYEFLDEGLDRLCTRYLQTPPHPVVIYPISETAQRQAEQVQAEVNSQPAPEPNQLSAEELVNRGMKREQENDHSGAVADYRAALALEPAIEHVHTLIGLALLAEGKHQDAFASFEQELQARTESAFAYFGRGLGHYEHTGDLAATIADFDKAIELDPDLSTSYFFRGVAKLDLGHYNEALSDLNQCIELEPDLANAYMRRAMVYVFKQEPGKALADLNKAIEIEPNHVDANAGRAHLFFHTGQFEEASSDISVVFQQRSDNVSDLELRAQVYLALQELDKALADVETGLKLEPQNAQFYYIRGQINREQEQYEAALAAYTKAIEYKPGYLEALVARGDMHMFLDQSEEALRDYDIVLQIMPHASAVHMSRASVHYALGNYTHSVEDATEAVRQNATPIWLAYQVRGMSHVELSNYREALHDLNAALEHGISTVGSGNGAKVLYYIAAAHVGLDEFAEAVESLTRYLETYNPDHADALHLRGFAFQELGNDEAAIADYTKSLELEPQRTAFSRRGTIYLGQDRYAEAIKDFSDAIRLQPDDDESYFFRGISRFCQGDLVGALVDYDQAIQLQPNAAFYYYSRGQLKKKRNDQMGALADLQKFLDMDTSGDTNRYHEVQATITELKRKINSTSWLKRLFS